MKPIFAIIVTHKRLEHFKNTVRTLVPTLPTGSMLAIVDNASGQSEYYDFLSQELSDITAVHGVRHRVLLNDSNDGWGAAMNEGLRVFSMWREYEYVLESNNDVGYSEGWLAKAQSHMEAHPEIGILGLWKHPFHGTRQELPDGLVIKDDMPATAWFMRSADLAAFLPFPEHGACKTRGGNGEDVAFRDKVQNKFGRWICGTKDDLAQHMDGYDIPDLGKPNPAYD